jgi:hypothetical protein
MKTEVGQNLYQSIHYDELSCRQVSYSVHEWTPSQEEHKHPKSNAKFFGIFCYSIMLYADERICSVHSNMHKKTFLTMDSISKLMLLSIQHWSDDAVCQR